jgi:CoA-transferase family III
MWEPSAQARRKESIDGGDNPPRAVGRGAADRFATVVMGLYAAQLIGDLGADVIKLEAPHDTLPGREFESISKLAPGELSEDPQVQEHLIEAVEKAYGSYSYAEISEKRDYKQLAALTH